MSTFATGDLVPPMYRLAEQLCHEWSAQSMSTPMPLTFADPAPAGAVTDQVLEPAHLYAQPLPPRSERLAPSASITMASSGSPSPDSGRLSRVRLMGLLVEARGSTHHEATELIHQLEQLLYPRGGSILELASKTIGDADQHVAQVPGVPAAVFDVALWRIIDIEPLTSIIAVPESGNRSAGEAVATWSLRASCVPFTALLAPRPQD